MVQYSIYNTTTNPVEHGCDTGQEFLNGLFGDSKIHPWKMNGWNRWNPKVMEVDGSNEFLFLFG